MPIRRLLAVVGLVLCTTMATSSPGLAQGGPPAMPVTVSPPLAKRVT